VLGSWCALELTVSAIGKPDGNAWYDSVPIPASHGNDLLKIRWADGSIPVDASAMYGADGARVVAYNNRLH
jgi:hypothetical protein